MKEKQMLLVFGLGVVLFLVVVVMIIYIIPRMSLFSSSGISDKNGYYSPETEQKEFEKGAELSILIDKLPYQGKHFSFAYDYDNAYFYVYFDPGNEPLGRQEFNSFLNQNGISNASQVIGLQVSDVPLPTPEP